MSLPTRRPYHGSCHCGLTRYIAYLTLPPPIITAESGHHTTRIYKCNCSTCQKAAIFHVRLPSPPDDFFLLSPISKDGSFGGIKTGEGGLKDYTCFEGDIHFYFCPNCGGRCFSLVGEGEIKSIPADSIPPPPRKYLHDSVIPPPQEVESNDGVIKAWSPKKEGWNEGQTYLSVNAVSLEPGQEGLDLREWTEQGWIFYLDTWEQVGEDRLKLPHEGGMY